MVLGFIIKAGIVGGFVFYTRQVGVWGSTQESKQLFKNLLRPHVQQLKKRLPFEVPVPPETGEMRFLAMHYYNQGVKDTFHFINILPCYAGQAVKNAKNTFNDFAASPTPTDTDTKK